MIPRMIKTTAAGWLSLLVVASAVHAAEAPFPRRMLAIRPNNYLYANPVTSGFRDEKGEFRHTVPAMMANIADRLNIDPSQFIDLSDSCPDEHTRGPLKTVIQDTVSAFLAGCREQDRIIVLFAGHAVEIDGEAFLVPLDGELNARATLIPLAWFHDRLSRCKARQKVLILDVCRADPDRGRERPTSPPLTPKFEAVLRKPPAGVQVLSACRAGEYSHEFELRGQFPGGVFLHQVHEVLARGAITRDATPADPLPLEALAREVGESVRQAVEANEGARQTPWLIGSEALAGARYNPNEPLPARLPLPTYPTAAGEAASSAVVASILNETDVIPPARPVPTELARLQPRSLPLFSAKVLADFQPDDKTSSLRDAVRKAIVVMRKHATTFPDDFPLALGDEDRFRADVMQIQKRTGRALLELQEALEELTQASQDRRLEASARWQANYDYVLARLLNRLAYVYEYNSALGSLRRELPPRDPRIHQGWRLVAREQPAGDRAGRTFAKNARLILEKLMRDYAGTPWEVLARRELANGLGLQWQPVRFGQ